MLSRPQVNDLVEQLCNPDFVIQPSNLMALAMELSSCKNQDAVEALKEKLTCPDQIQQHLAAYFILEVYPESEASVLAIACINESLEKEDFESNVSAMNWINQISKIPQEFVPSLTNDRWNQAVITKVLAAACLARSNLVSHETLTSLRLAVSSDEQPPFVALTATIALLRLGANTEEAISKLMQLVERKIVTIDQAVCFFRQARDSSRCGKVMREILQQLPPDSGTIPIALHVLGEIDLHSTETRSFVFERMKSAESGPILCGAWSGLANRFHEISDDIIESLVDRLTSKDLSLREAIVQSLIELPPGRISAYASKIVERFEYERDILILEKLSRICVRIGEAAIEPLQKVMSNTRNARYWFALTTFGEIGEENRELLIKALVSDEIPSADPHMVAMFLGTYGSLNDAYVETIQELLSSSDDTEIEVGLLAIRKAGRSAERLCPRLIEIATGMDPELALLARNSLESIGSVVLKYIAPICEDESSCSLRKHLENWLDTKGTPAYDLSWVGDLELVRHFCALGRIYRELGSVGFRALEPILKERKAAKMVPESLPEKASTIRALFEKLDQLVSNRYHRSITVLEGEATKPKKLSAEGIEFLRKCESYLKSLAD